MHWARWHNFYLSIFMFLLGWITSSLFFFCCSLLVVVVYFSPTLLQAQLIFFSADYLFVQLNFFFRCFVGLFYFIIEFIIVRLYLSRNMDAMMMKKLKSKHSSACGRLKLSTDTHEKKNKETCHRLPCNK